MEKDSRNRITQMEERLNKLDEIVRHSKSMLERLESSSADYKILKEYYTSPQWRQDFEASNQPDFPAPDELPHGVLSEDAVYMLIYDYQELGNCLIELGKRMNSMS